MEDVDLTQQNNDSPVELSGKEVSATLRQSLFQDVHVFFQVVNIETDKDIIGFGLDSIKKEIELNKLIIQHLIQLKIYY